MKIKELIELIEQWAIDRGLDKNGTVEGQLIKTAEEVSELIIAISKNNVKDIRDAVGDVFVTLVVANLLKPKIKIDLVLVELYSYYPEGVISKKNLVTSLFGHTSYMLSSQYSSVHVEGILIELLFVCNTYNLKFEECVEASYKEIAGRKGRVIDGTFVKEDDLI